MRISEAEFNLKSIRNAEKVRTMEDVIADIMADEARYNAEELAAELEDAADAAYYDIPALQVDREKVLELYSFRPETAFF